MAKFLRSVEVIVMTDVMLLPARTDTKWFHNYEDACPSAHFNKTEPSICAFYISMRRDKSDGTYWEEALKDGSTTD